MLQGNRKMISHLKKINKYVFYIRKISIFVKRSLRTSKRIYCKSHLLKVISGTFFKWLFSFKENVK